jgi:hypothetical protein
MRRRIEVDLHTTDLTLDDLQRRLCSREKQFGMTSADFERRYFDGEMGDDPAVMQWIRDYSSYKLLLKSIAHPKAVGV